MKLFLGNFYRHLAIFFWSHWDQTTPTLFALVSVTRFCEISTLWQNFNRLWEIFGRGLFWYSANIWTCFGNFMILGKFSITQTSKDWKIISTSGHTVCGQSCLQLISTREHSLELRNGKYLCTYLEQLPPLRNALLVYVMKSLTLRRQLLNTIGHWSPFWLVPIWSIF